MVSFPNQHPPGQKNIPNGPEDILDLTLRPKNWQHYVGQDNVKNNLRVIIDAAKQRSEAIEHLLLHGNPGLGKTTLAHLIAQEAGVPLRVTSGPALEKAGDLAAILTNLPEGSILFCDEIHRLPRLVEETLYPAMEDFRLNLVLGKGPMARIMELKIPRFTLVGATTRLAAISSPLRSRFGATFGLNFYELSDIAQILKRSGDLLGVTIDPEALQNIAQAARYTPRIANHLLKRVRDFAQVEHSTIITPRIAQKALTALEIDPSGLTANDRRLLEALVHKFNGGPVGLKTLASATAEEEQTILDVYEPYLLRLGLIALTPRGRTATILTYQHLRVKAPPHLF